MGYAIVGNLIEKCIIGRPPVTVLLANKDKAVLDADYDRIIDLEYSNAFFDIAPSTRHTWFKSLHPGIAALAMLAVAAVLARATMSRRNAPDGKEYLTME